MDRTHNIIRAVYSGGVFKPLQKVSLPEGEKVELEIKKEKPKKNISLRGIWKGIQISEEDIDRAMHIWDGGLEKQLEILKEETNV